MTDKDRKTQMVIVEIINAVPGKEVLDIFETHARRRSFVLYKFLARYNALTSTIFALFPNLSLGVRENISEKVVGFTDTLEEFGECIEDSGKDVIMIGESYQAILQILQKALD